MVPEHLAAAWRGDPDGEAWLASLPRLRDECAERWDLDLGPPWTNSAASLTMPARRDGEARVLKLAFPDREGLHEPEALARWGGEGAVRLLDHDPERRAMLLERCLPGTPLTELEPERALDVVIDLLPRLWVPAEPPFRPIGEEVADLVPEMLAHWERTGRTVDARLIDAARAAFDELVPTQGPPVLVSQDLHADNILRAKREPWLTIDPKPLLAEREFGVAPIVRGAELGHDRRSVLRRLDRVSAELGLDRERVRLWTIAHTVAWGFDRVPLATHIEAATWLLDAR
jgi:streptomycin 6-kinase